MSGGYVLYQPLVYLRVSVRCAVGVYIHIGVGFCVARSTVPGNAKASMCGTGNRYRLPRFFRLCTLMSIG